MAAGVVSGAALVCSARLPVRHRKPPNGVLLVLDIIYVLGVIALFVLVGVVGKAVEKL